MILRSWAFVPLPREDGRDATSWGSLRLMETRVKLRPLEGSPPPPSAQRTLQPWHPHLSNGDDYSADMGPCMSGLVKR